MKKIMFDDHFGLTNAVMEGRKTMTRRFAEKVLIEDEKGFLCWNGEFKNPRYKPGEVVAVAQSLQDMRYDPRDTRHKSGAIWGLDHTPAWTNKMFVSASECIHHIRITNVRLERLQDISDEDCLREGVRKLESEGNPTMFTFDGWKFKNKVNRCADSPKEVFAALIDKISGNGTWEKNPWVLVYSFELIK